MGFGQYADLLRKTRQLEKSFERSLVDYRRFYTVATNQSERRRVVELNVLA
jgi:hypothetical protein